MDIELVYPKMSGKDDGSFWVKIDSLLEVRELTSPLCTFALRHGGEWAIMRRVWQRRRCRAPSKGGAKLRKPSALHPIPILLLLLIRACSSRAVSYYSTFCHFSNSCAPFVQRETNLILPAKKQLSTLEESITSLFERGKSAKMGKAGRIACIATPMALTVVSLILLIVVFLGGWNKNDSNLSSLYYFRVSTNPFALTGRLERLTNR